MVDLKACGIMTNTKGDSDLSPWNAGIMFDESYNVRGSIYNKPSHSLLILDLPCYENINPTIARLSREIIEPS